jgi:hypothetical protein
MASAAAADTGDDEIAAGQRVVQERHARDADPPVNARIYIGEYACVRVTTGVDRVEGVTTTRVYKPITQVRVLINWRPTTTFKVGRTVGTLPRGGVVACVGTEYLVFEPTAEWFKPDLVRVTLAPEPANRPRVQAELLLLYSGGVTGTLSLHHLTVTTGAATTTTA